MGKWKKKYGPALWVKVLGAEAKQPERMSQRSIKAMSNTMQLMVATYKAEKRKWWKLHANQECRKCGCKLTPKNRQLHHKFGRLGKLLLDKRFWIACCFVCHRWIHDNVEEARKEGLLAMPGEWNTQRP